MSQSLSHPRILLPPTPCTFLRRRRCVLLTCLLFLTLLLDAQLKSDLSLPYLVREASVKTAKPPMIILLHGYGSNEADLFAFQTQLPPQYVVISVRAPLTLSEGSYQWFRMEQVNGNMQGNRNDVKNSCARIRTFIREAVAAYHTDSGQTYLCGFSQGAMMCYEVGLSSPELVKGIAPLSGKIFDALKNDIKQTADLKALNVFIGHGDADNRVAYSYATAAKTYLMGLGLKPQLHTYPGLPHSISQQELTDLVNWLK